MRKYFSVYFRRSKLPTLQGVPTRHLLRRRFNDNRGGSRRAAKTRRVEARLALPLHYNRALDGLRAVAVLLVISDHCGVPVFDQGYFGVDLFFVLSGFLITRLLVDEIDATG